MIIKMIWLNLWRNSRRTIITLSSVMFAVLLAITMKSLQDGVFDNLVKNVVSFYSGYIQIHKKGYWDERILENTFSQNDSIEKLLKLNTKVSSFTPRLESFALASTGKTTYGCLVIGTDPEKENLLSSLKNKLAKGNYFSENDSGVMIGEGLATKLSIGLNDTLVLLGQGYQESVAAGKFPVKGILHFGSPQLNESAVYLTLPAAQQWLSATGLLSSFAVNVSSSDELENISNYLRSNLSEEYEVMTWKEMMPEIETHIRADSNNFYIMFGVLYLIIAFGIFGTILMMTNERRFEFGMLLAIGMKKIRIARMLIGETILLSIIGTVGGMLISLPVVIYFSKYPIRFGGAFEKAYKQFGFEAKWPTILEPNIFFTQAVIVLILALIIGIYPLWYVRKLDPVKAMHK